METLVRDCRCATFSGVDFHCGAHAVRQSPGPKTVVCTFRAKDGVDGMCTCRMTPSEALGFILHLLQRGKVYGASPDRIIVWLKIDGRVYVCEFHPPSGDMRDFSGQARWFDGCLTDDEALEDMDRPVRSDLLRALNRAFVQIVVEYPNPEYVDKKVEAALAGIRFEDLPKCYGLIYLGIADVDILRRALSASLADFIAAFQLAVQIPYLSPDRPALLRELLA